MCLWELSSQSRVGNVTRERAQTTSLVCRRCVGCRQFFLFVVDWDGIVWQKHSISVFCRMPKKRDGWPVRHSGQKKWMHREWKTVVSYSNGITNDVHEEWHTKKGCHATPLCPFALQQTLAQCTWCVTMCMAIANELATLLVSSNRKHSLLSQNRCKPPGTQIFF